MTPVAPAGTGPGPMPGTDPRESARVVMGECHALPFLPELPERGPGADQIGRTPFAVNREVEESEVSVQGRHL